MHISEVEKMRLEKEHNMRHGHLSEKDRDEMAMHRYGANKFDKNYHSPEESDEQIPQNNYGPVAP